MSTYGQVFKWLSNGKWQMEKQQQNGRSIICMNAPKASIQFWYFLNGNHQNDRKSSEIKSVVREILVIVVWANKNEPSHASDEKAPFALWIKLVIHLNAIHMFRSQMKPIIKIWNIDCIWSSVYIKYIGAPINRKQLAIDSFDVNWHLHITFSLAISLCK